MESRTVELSHLVTVKVVLPVLDALIQRTYSQLEDADEAPPYVWWIRENGYALRDRLRRALGETPWGAKPLRITLNADELGLLALGVGLLRHRRQTQVGEQELDGAALEEARQRLWLTLPLDTELVWWLPRPLAFRELLPLVRAVTTSSNPAAREHARRLQRVVEERLAQSDSDTLRLPTRLDDLAWLAEQAAASARAPQLRQMLERLIDPLLVTRASVSGGRQARARASDAGRTAERRAKRGLGDEADDRTAAQRTRPQTAQAETGSPPPAPVLRRVAAGILDAVIFYVASIPVSLVIVLVHSVMTSSASGGDTTLADLSTMLLFFGWGYLYWIYPVGRWGATAGKHVLSLKVVTAAGTPPGQAKAFVRSAVAGIVGSFLFFHWWFVPFRGDRRGLHDLAADVWVVKQR